MVITIISIRAIIIQFPYYIRIGHINIRSCRNKTQDVINIIDDHDIHILVITETWLSHPCDDPIMKAMTPVGFEIKSFPRVGRTGGGIAILYKSSLVDKISFKPQTFNSFEYAGFTLTNHQCKHYFHCVYRPPHSAKNRSTSSDFLLEFREFISHRFMTSKNNTFIGDFNIDYHGDKPDSNNFRDLLSEHNLIQHVAGPTNDHGHTIDHVITDQDSPLSTTITNIDKFVSDHHLIFYNIRHFSNQQIKKVVTSRDYKNINLDALKSDLSSMTMNLQTVTAENVQSMLLGAINKHAPQKTRVVNERPQTPWFDSTTKNAKQQRRKSERKWQRSGLAADREIYLHDKRRSETVNRHAKKRYINEKLANTNSPKEFFRITNDLLGNETKSPLPSDINKFDLPNHFGQYFNNKIETIRNDLQNYPLDCDVNVFSGLRLLDFNEVTENDVSSCILSAASKSCALDPIRTDTLKACLEQIITPLTCIMNESLQIGVVPDIFKIAHVKPLLKKTNLDKENLKNYRPVSNLPFLSKILERLVLKQLLSHLKLNSLEETFQSAYREHHSTETALVRVVNDLLNLIDQGSCSLLSLLDLSSAFDTIDHGLLLKRLQTTYGISGTALKWFESYLYNRRQVIVVDEFKSVEFRLECGVPQGSVLGPVLFVLYVGPLSGVIRSFGLSYHQYADDTQLFGTECTKDVRNIAIKSEKCILGVRDWMCRNRLKLNDDKTEVMYVGNKKFRNASALRSGEATIDIVDKVKNLGVFLDSNLSMEHQLNNLVKSLSWQLKKISSIRHFISGEVTVKLVVTLVFSKLDYCNAMLFGIPQCMLKRLQIVQNNAARLVFRRRRCDSVTPLLRRLHWLPVERRIVFKACVLVYRCLEKSAPPYLSELLKHYTIPRSLRSSSDSTRLAVPRIRTKAGARSFSHFGPSMWNAIPQSVRESQSLSGFKKSLKTFLF